MGILVNLWLIIVIIKVGIGNVVVKLVGIIIVKYNNGWVNFIDLVISYFGDDYILNFIVIYLVGVNLFILINFSLLRRFFKVNVMSILIIVVVNFSIFLVIKLEDVVIS